jgi:hypothetical protein
MHVVWKRPDGFHDSDPSDFTVVSVGNRAKIWLHKKDHSWFPFRIAGGWQESEATKRLNNMVNLLSREDSVWVETLLRSFNDTMGDDGVRYFDDLTRWVTDLRNHLKGDTWELDIMNHALAEVADRLAGTREAFLKAAKHD